MKHKRLSLFTALALLGAVALVGTAAASTLLEGKGSVSGTVKAEDGKPVIGLLIKLEQDIPMTAGTRGGSKGKGKSSFGDSGASELQTKKPRKKILGQTTTDQNGKFSFTNIDEGAARLVAGNRNLGWIYQDVEIKANENTDVGELKLIKPK